MSKPEVQHMLTVLKTAMRVLGYTNRDVERKLGLSSSYLSRLFSGVIELRFEHIVDISHSIGMELDEILHFAYPYPKQPPTAGATRLRELVGGGLPLSPMMAAAPAPPPNEEDLERLMAKTLRKLFGELSRAQEE
jgi:transcriptional regulator with XRE-family HTH domain